MNSTKLAGIGVLGASFILLLTGLSGLPLSPGLTGQITAATEQVPLDYDLECRRTTDSSGSNGPADSLTLHLEAEVTNTDTEAGRFDVTFTVDEYQGNTITRTETLSLEPGETKTAAVDIQAASNYATSDCTVDPGTRTVTQ